MTTQAQIAAVEALELPFILSETDIERQFNKDGTAKPASRRDPMSRVRELADNAANNQAPSRKAA